MKWTTWVLTLSVVWAVAIAGCGGGDDTGSSGSAYGGKGGDYGGAPAASEEPNSEAGAGPAVLSTAPVGELGAILVDSRGMTLYDFHKDKGTTSSCYGACAENWPPLLTDGETSAAGGASAAKLGTTERKDGSTQVTYAGHPLYTYTGDQGPGEANGNDVEAFGAEWYALQASGEEPEG